MDSKNYNKYSEEFAVKVLDIYTILNLLSYIIFSAIRRLFDNEKLLWIPFIIFTINFLILSESFYKVKRSKSTLSRKNSKRFILYIIYNLICAVAVLSYFL
jgi:hypothetical protein